MLNYNRRLQILARELRKNMTEAEKILWSRLSRRQMSGHQFYRHRVIGEYIVNFYCPRSRLVIEIDTGQHHHTKTRADDRKREQTLRELGLTVLKFSNVEVTKELEGVLDNIHRNLKKDKT